MTHASHDWKRPAAGGGAAGTNPPDAAVQVDPAASKSGRLAGASRSRRGAAIVRRLPAS